MHKQFSPRWLTRAASSSSKRTQSSSAGGPGSQRSSQEEAFYDLDAPVTRVAGASVPLPFAQSLEEEMLPSVDEVVDKVQELVAM